MKTTEEYIRQTQNMDVETFVKLQRKRARITAFVLASAVVISLLFCMFAFVQKAEADKQRDLTENLSDHADKLRIELEACRGK